MSHRRDYLDAIEPADDGYYSPIVTMLSETYLNQHKEVADQVMIQMKEPRKNSKIDYLVKNFYGLKKNMNHIVIWEELTEKLLIPLIQISTNHD